MERYKSALLFLAAIMVIFFSLNAVVLSVPDSVTVTFVRNATNQLENGTIANVTYDGSKSGGYIFTMTVSGNSQNIRWKAFIGNVTGKLVLQDSAGATLYDWTLATISGEIYATRHADTINWSGINCAGLNATENENINLSHTSNVADNISATFNGTDNQAMTVGTKTVIANSCRTINTFINSGDQGESSDNFEEIILHDRENGTMTVGDFSSNFSKIVYAQNVESDAIGYDNVAQFDFQMIVPERGSNGWAGSTAYYFYIELS